MMRSMLRFGLIWGVAASCLLCGCSTFTHYTKKMEPTTTALRAGNVKQAEALFPEKGLKSGTDRVVYLLDKGTLQHVASNYEQSDETFTAANKIFEDNDMRAKIAVGKALEGAGSVVLNDKVMPYESEAYERIYMHTLEAINYLMLGNKEDARVEIKLAYEQAKVVADKNAKDLEKAQRDADEKKVEGKRSVSEAFAQLFSANDLDRIERSTFDPYQNAFTSYLSSAVYEMNRQYNDAYIDCQSAHEIAPNAALPASGLARLAGLSGMRERKAEWEQKFGPAPKADPNGGDLLVLFQCGLVAHKEQVKLTIPVPVPSPRTHTISVVLVTVAFPRYHPTPTRAAGLEVLCDGQSLGATEMLTDLDIIALKNFHKKVPALVLRQAIRAALKAAASYEASGLLGQLGPIDVSSLVVSGALSFTEQADLRSWLLLPSNVQSLRQNLPGGDHDIELLLKDGAGAVIDRRAMKTTIAPGKFTVMNLRGIDSFVGDPQVSKPL